MKYQSGNLIIEYFPVHFFSTIYVKVYNEQDVLDYEGYASPTDSIHSISEMEPCARYKVIISASNHCFSSDTAYYNGCLPGQVHCETLYEPIPLGEFVPIPAFLSCGYQKPCISCETLNSLVTEFRQLYPSMEGAPYDSAVTDQQAAQNSLLTRFLNYKTGFSASMRDYLDAYALY